MYAFAPINRRMDRNHPRVVRTRLACCLMASAFAWISTLVTRAKAARAGQVDSIVDLLGMRLDRSIPSFIVGSALTVLLFAGPVALKWPVNAPEWKDVVVQRNLIFSPLCEEFVFRSCVTTLLRLNGFGFWSTVLLTPLFFGAAHLHHLFELLVFHRMRLAMAMAQIAFQFCYTTLFGWYAAYLFLSTRSIAGCIVAHQICNFLGFPDFSAIPGHPKRRTVILLLIGGILAFCYLIGSVHRV